MDVKHLSINEIREWFKEAERQEVLTYMPSLKEDKRIGIQQLIQQWAQKEKHYQQRVEKWEMMTQEERHLQDMGITLIAGLDEVGRGPLAGPVVAAAVILPSDFYLLGIDDSKKLTPAEREEYAKKIKQEAICYSISFVDHKEIDRINILQATIKAMGQAISELQRQPEYLLIDAMRLPIALPQKSIIKGDAKSISIAAASIIAKVARDEYMCKLAELYPEYGFERNMGYGTKEHQQALERHGITPIHRLSFLTKQIDLAL
jgi:ribonuclease HII